MFIPTIKIKTLTFSYSSPLIFRPYSVSLVLWKIQFSQCCKWLSWLFFSLEFCLTPSLTFITLMLLKAIGQLLCRPFFNLSLPWFLQDESGTWVGIFDRIITKMMLFSCILLVAHSFVLFHDWTCFFWSVKMEFLVFSIGSYSFLSKHPPRPGRIVFVKISINSFIYICLDTWSPGSVFYSVIVLV
jgi:hypothetical protein